MLIVIAAGTYWGYRLWQYTQHDPVFCRTCHIMESAWDAWQTSVHAKVECHACHTQSVRENLEQLFKFVTLRPQTIGKHAEVDYTKCGACHLSQDPRWLQVQETAGHKVHFEHLGLACVGCHSKGVHRFVRPNNSCTDCHADVVIKAAKMEALHCTACHNFLATDAELKTPTRQQCLDCHAAVLPAAAGFPANAPMRFACNQCHHPHAEGRPTIAACRQCHRMQEYGLHAQSGHADCITCHAAHTWRPSERATCEACHSDKGNHYPGTPCALCHSFAAGVARHPPG
jgi:hypothetical protein